LFRANCRARLGVSKSSRFNLPSIWRTISASSRRLLNRSSMIKTVLRCALASASSEITAFLEAGRVWDVFIALSLLGRPEAGSNTYAEQIPCSSQKRCIACTDLRRFATFREEYKSKTGVPHGARRGDIHSKG